MYQTMQKNAFFLACLVLSLLPGRTVARQDDSLYSAKIREYTTAGHFLNPLVDHLPQSDTVPSPLDFFGTIIGAPGRLHYVDEIYAYLRALAKASPRVMVRSIGRTEENREMIEVIIADEAGLDSLEIIRRSLNRLADPRTLSADSAQHFIRTARPIYYVTAGLHSPETGPPEMVMELAYRLAVEETPFMQMIRRNVIFIFCPVAEPDGRDRVVDVFRYRSGNRGVGPNLTFWGKYVAHDNNRDGYGLGLALTRNILQSFMHWKATVMHDLHESVPFLYISTGLGPYNEHLDPLTINEWHNLAHEEVTELTRAGMPGVWTHGFYNGWAGNYLIWMANLRNATGRFYETFSNHVPETLERTIPKRMTSVQWYRPNPPLKKTQWSLRNNTNYMQSGVLVALNYVARNRTRFVDSFYLKSRNAVRRGKSEAPYAYVIPARQRRVQGVAGLINLLRLQGLEVHRAQEKLRWSMPAGDKKAQAEKARTITVEKGAYVIRLDQPYRTLARVLLDKQNFPKDAKPPYDDTGWTLPMLHQVQCFRVDDPAVLQAKMTLLDSDVRLSGELRDRGRALFLINNTTDDQVALLRFRLADVPMLAADEPFRAGRRNFAAGTLIIDRNDLRQGRIDSLAHLAQELGLEIIGIKRLPEVAVHPVETPRIALVHTWVATPQDAGWWRLAFDRIGIPYTHLSEQDLASVDLQQFDVIIMPRHRARPQTLVSGTTGAGPAIPWQRSDSLRHIGVIDETYDQRRGMGFEGVQKLKAFIESGGVFITEGTSSAFPIDMALTRRVSIVPAKKLQARGSVVKAEIADRKSPITYGYADTAAVYFSGRPIFQVNKNTGNYLVPDWLKDEIWFREVPRVVVKFPKKGILLSGMMRGEQELAGKPMIIDVPAGKGHVVLFANRPFWRYETAGSHGFVWNTLLHWNDLHLGWPERPEENSAHE